MPGSVNVFGEQESYNRTIYERANWEKIGGLRVKPSSILWKLKGGHKYFSVSLDEFALFVIDRRRWRGSSSLFQPLIFRVLAGHTSSLSVCIGDLCRISLARR